MKRIIMVVHTQIFRNTNEESAYQNQVKNAIEVQPSQNLSVMFFNTKTDDKKKLHGQIPAWPHVIVFDECHHGTIKKVHNVLSKQKSTIFYAKNFGIADHKIQGINTIETMGVIPLHLTTL